MTGYTPIFSKIVDSSLWCEPDNVVKIFITLLAKKDADNVVRGSAFNISQWAKKTEAEVIEALNTLAAPDTRRIEPQPFDGRRIERVDDGWLILNGKFYQDLMRSVNRRAKKAGYEKDRRERLKQNGAREESQASEKPAKVNPTTAMINDRDNLKRIEMRLETIRKGGPISKTDPQHKERTDLREKRKELIARLGYTV